MLFRVHWFLWHKHMKIKQSYKSVPVFCDELYPFPFIIMKALHQRLILVSDSANDIILLPLLFSWWSVSPSRSSTNHSEKLCQMLAPTTTSKMLLLLWVCPVALHAKTKGFYTKIYRSNKTCVLGRVELHCLKIFSSRNSPSSPR